MVLDKCRGGECAFKGLTFVLDFRDDKINPASPNPQRHDNHLVKQKFI